MEKYYFVMDEYKADIIKVMSEMIAIPAISPVSGGKGESARADFLKKVLEEFGFEVKRYDYYDESKTKRSNLVSKQGNGRNTLWIVGHIDTVSEGDMGLWKYKPFEATLSGDRIYGRGTNDNGQGVISGIFAMKAAKENKKDQNYNFGVVLVADEELGSGYGIKKLLEEGIFDKDDLFIVPDAGNEEGTEIEIAEKGMLWLKFTVTGKQAHASTPEKGINAFRYSLQYINEADCMLHEKYNAKDSLFNTDTSTFEMTKHEKNVDSVNIIPGKEVFYIDCRVLPNYRLDDVISDLEQLAKADKFKNVKINIEIFNRNDPAPITEKDSKIVKILSKKINEVLNVEPKTIGIGGGTCAAFFREKNMKTVVWSKQVGTEHQPNEYTNISDIISNIEVFLSVYYAL